MTESTRFIQGVFPFEGGGLDRPAPLPAATEYMVPRDKRAQFVYFRGGNGSDELIVVTLMRDGKTMRHFPIGAKSSVHVPLALVEDVFPESKLSLQIAAPKGAVGMVVIDVGIIEVN
jgi:hypothetical protein